MPEPQNPRRDRRSHTDDAEKNRKRDYSEERQPSGERQIFEEMIQRRLGGGATPTPEAYAKAMQQWQELPGAVQFVAVPALPQSEPDAQSEKPKTSADPV
jgi:hypothetical protein